MSNQKPSDNQVPDALRPAGFKKVSSGTNPANTKPEKANIVEQKKPAISNKHLKPIRVRTPKPKKKRKKKAGNILPIIVTAVIALILVSAAVFVITGGGKPVHQMPTILRITEAPTAEPNQAPQ